MNLNLIKLTAEQREALFPSQPRPPLVNSLERLAITVVGALALLFVYGTLSMAWAGGFRQVPGADGCPQADCRDGAEMCQTTTDKAYDKEHRKFLGLPPGECVLPAPGYPTAAAGWLEAVQAQQEGRPARPYKDGQ